MTKEGNNLGASATRIVLAPVVVMCLFLVGCERISAPKTSPFYAEAQPPAVQELRWSNGPSPKTFDPARASAAPETDVVRAVYEGLTEIDPKTLSEVPALAESWSHDRDYLVWTFKLREDARWSNGRRVVATDFVTSWRRAATMEEKVPNRSLMRNIVGLSERAIDESEPDYESQAAIDAAEDAGTPTAQDPATHNAETPAEEKTRDKVEKKGTSIGIEAVDETTLRVKLEIPDKDFAKLVANTVFRPVYDGGASFIESGTPEGLVTNGAFAIVHVSPAEIVLERSEEYWNKENVTLQRVRLPVFESAEAALAAYRSGELDAVTNADFEPLALKLLQPFDDFKRSRHGALNFYEINTERAPFNDRRVRQALAKSIDRERLTESDLDGAPQPAASFLPLSRMPESAVSFDAVRARELLDVAGFPGGSGFPPIRLLINRNDAQQRVARSVARMWKQYLNIDTEIVVKDSDEYDDARTTLDYDVVRRGVVLPTLDETVSLETIFGRSARVISEENTVLARSESEGDSSAVDGSPAADVPELPADDEITEIFTQDDALFQMTAIPLYFPTAYSLVKPYVEGFEVVGMDAPLLSGVRINNEWRAK